VKHKVSTGTFFDQLDDRDLRQIMVTGELGPLICARLWRYAGLPGEPPDVIRIAMPSDLSLDREHGANKRFGNAC
jgi:hypothetical protein